MFAQRQLINKRVNSGESLDVTVVEILFGSCSDPVDPPAGLSLLESRSLLQHNTDQIPAGTDSKIQQLEVKPGARSTGVKYIYSHTVFKYTSEVLVLEYLQSMLLYTQTSAHCQCRGE